MHKFFYIFIVVLLIVSSCTLEDDSTPQGNIKVAEAKELLPSAIQQVAFNHSAIGARTTASIMQYIKGGDSKPLSTENYLFSNAYFEGLWTDGYYTGSLILLNELLSLSDDNESLKAISLILLAHEYTHLTFYFGDIPMQEALQGDEFSEPTYDTQTDVLSKIIAQLDEAIELIGDRSVDENLVEEDLLFQGSLTRWKKFAYGLKARVLYNQGIGDSDQQALLLNSLDNSFLSHTAQADFTFDKGVDNPQYAFEIERPSTFSTGIFYQNLLEQNQDPRRSQVTIEGVFEPWDYFINDVFVSKWFDRNATIPLLSFTELQFMRVELLLAQGASINAIQTSLAVAIEASLLEYDLQIDTSPEIINFIASQSNLSGLTSEEILNRIMEQAYVAYYGYNYLQAWNNYRRTGYPAIESTANDATIYLNNPSNSVPQRFLYPSSERELNMINVESAITRQNGALLDEPLPVFE